MLALATLPSPVRAQYLRTSDKLKPKIDARMRAMVALEQAPRSQWKTIAKQLEAALRPIIGRGLSAKRILDLHREYRRHGPEVLMLGYRDEEDAKPAEFVNHLAARCEKNKRVASVELEAVIAEWYSGANIPGYGTWREKWVKDFGENEPMPDQCPDWFVPPGWSPRNLRRYLPGDAAIELARHGYFAAHGLLPQKRNDYSQLRPLEMVVFDDVKPDWLVSYPGVTHACEIWLLVAMDVATRTVLDWVSLAAVPDDEGKRAELLEQHMKILGGALLARYGIPTEYKMTWLVENQKATYRDAAKLALTTLSGGQIEVKHTRMVNRALPSGHTERHGTPYDIKGVLESFFKSFHNHAGSLPGQTGSIQMLNAPAELAQQQKEHAQLMAEIEDLPPAVHELLKLSFLRYFEAVDACEKIFAKLNNRTNHRLEGFSRVEVFRFPTDLDWRPTEELRRYPAAEIKKAVFNWRMQSPIERLQQLLREQPPFARVPAEALLPFSARIVKKVRHPAPYTIAWVEQGTEFMYRGEVPELASGKGGPFFVKILPDDTSVAYLHDSDSGVLLGTLARVIKSVIGDPESEKRAVGELQHYRSLVVQPVMERHAAERAERTKNTELNDAIIAAARTGTEMIAAATETKATKRKQTHAEKRRNAERAALLAARAEAQINAGSSTL